MAINAALISRSMVSFARYWLPLLIWMAVIFSASADAQSTERTSRFLEPLLRWINPNISLRSIEKVRWGVRKMAHATEFGLLAWLLWRALRKPKRNDSRPWSWKPVVATFAIILLYAIGDEFHQRFVPNRTPSMKDVVIDTAGAVLALTVISLWHARGSNRAGLGTAG